MRMHQTEWYRTFLTVLTLSVGLLASACATAPEVGQTQPGGVGAPPPSPPPVVTPAPPPAPPKVTEAPPSPTAPVAEKPVTPAPSAQAGPPLEDAFFDFDKAVLRDDAKASLNRNITWLRANPAVKITVEGHCDERGTNEYNLALGERRARAVRDYLVAAGIAAGRVQTISYGEERPFVLGHDESAWRWNRRGHFVIQR